MTQVKQIDMGMVTVAEDQEGKYWFFDRLHMVVGYFCEKNCQVHIVNRYNKKKNFDAYDIYCIDNILYITSQRTAEILVYDMMNNCFQFHESNLRETQYASALLKNKDILLIPAALQFPSIIYHIREGSFEEKQWLKDETCREDFLGRPLIDGNRVLLPIYNKNYMIVLDLATLEYQSIFLSQGIRLQCVSTEINNAYYFTQSDKREIIRYADGKEEKIPLDEDILFDNAFSKIFYLKGKLIMLPRYDNYIYVFDTDSKKSIKCRLPEKFWDITGGASKIFDCFVRGDKVICLPWALPYICEIDLNTYKMDLKPIFVTYEDYSKWILKDFVENCMYNGKISEYSELGLEDFIQYISNGYDTDRHKDAEFNTTKMI